MLHRLTECAIRHTRLRLCTLSLACINGVQQHVTLGPDKRKGSRLMFAVTCAGKEEACEVVYGVTALCEGPTQS